CCWFEPPAILLPFSHCIGSLVQAGYSQQKNQPACKIRGISQMPPLRLASLPLFPRSQVRRCHPIRFRFVSGSIPYDRDRLCLFVSSTYPPLFAPTYCSFPVTEKPLAFRHYAAT